MHIHFIYPSDNYIYNAGIGYLSAVLKQEGHTTSLAIPGDYDERPLEEFLGFDRNPPPDVIALSVVTNQLPAAKKIISLIHTQASVPIIVGGVHATLSPEDFIHLPGVHAVCRGEGEDALREYVQCLAKGKSPSKISNLWVKSGDRIIKNPLRPLRQNLDSLPPPDYSLFNYERILQQIGVFMVFGNRGCPYHCSYCVNHSLMALYGSQGYLRTMSVDRLLHVIEESMKPYPEAKVIEFFDDTFIINKQWVKEFCDKYTSQIGLPYYVNVRADLVNEEIVRVLTDSGCIRVNMAIETGDESLRRDILGKKITDEQLIKAFHLFNKAGITTYAHNMVGIPYETEENILKGIALNKACQVDDLQCWVFYPYPGSEAWRVCKENGWISERFFSTVAGSVVVSVLDQPGITYERVSYYHRVFKYLVKGDEIVAEERPRDYMLLGINEGQMISGWNNLELDEGTPFRWTKEDARFYLRNSHKKYISFLLNFPAPQPPPLVEISINGVNVGQIIPKKGEWQWFEVYSPPFNEPLLEVSLKVQKPYIPSMNDPADQRKLGVAVSQIVMESEWDRIKRRYRSGTLLPKWRLAHQSNGN